MPHAIAMVALMQPNDARCSLLFDAKPVEIKIPTSSPPSPATHATHGSPPMLATASPPLQLSSVSTPAPLVAHLCREHAEDFELRRGAARLALQLAHDVVRALGHAHVDLGHAAEREKRRRGEGETISVSENRLMQQRKFVRQIPTNGGLTSAGRTACPSCPAARRRPRRCRRPSTARCPSPRSRGP